MFNFIIQQIRQPGKGTITTLSIILSLVLWAILKLNNYYFTTLSYPCKITNVPTSVLLQSNVLPNIVFSVKAKGSVLFGEYWKWHKDTLELKYQNSFDKGLVILSPNKYAFSHFPEDIEIVDIQENTIPIYLLPSSATKRVPIRNQVNVKLAEGFAIFNEPILSPDSVDIYGTNENIAKIEAILTESKEIYLKDSKATIEVKLKTNSVFRVSDTFTKITFSPEKYTEISPQVKIEINDLPANKSVKLFPDMLNPKCKVPISEYDKWVNQTWIWKIPYQKLAHNEVIIPNFDFFPPSIQYHTCETKEIHYVVGDN
jgi:hypothetical protein